MKKKIGIQSLVRLFVNKHQQRQEEWASRKKLIFVKKN